MINLYYSFVYPYLKYEITAWGNQTKSIMRKLQIIQNKIICIMDFKFLKDCVKRISMYKSMKILQIQDIQYMNLKWQSLCILFIIKDFQVYLMTTLNI